MGWQRRSSGNNYASLSGHGFLIGVHTRRIIACVVFSKKCAIYDKRKGNNNTVCHLVSDPSPPSSSSSHTTTDTPPATPTNNTTLPPVGNIDLATPPPPSGLVTINHSIDPLSSLDDPTITAESGFIDTSSMDHQCTRNYDGSSGAMESDGLLLLMQQLEAKYEGAIYLDYVVTDDDTKMKKYLTHPKYRPKGKKNIGGQLPLSIPEPNWYADPTHRAKCVAGAFFELTKGKKTPARAHKLDAFRIKNTTLTTLSKTGVRV